MPGTPGSPGFEAADTMQYVRRSCKKDSKLYSGMQAVLWARVVGLQWYPQKIPSCAVVFTRASNRTTWHLFKIFRVKSYYNVRVVSFQDRGLILLLVVVLIKLYRSMC